MSHFVRQSKFRHVYIEPAKLESCYTNVRLATATGEQNYIKGNTKFFAVSIQAGGGAMAVVPYDKVGKFDPDFPLISGHRGAILDFDFNPFHEHLIASASDDSTIKIWGIPEGGLAETCVDPLVDLSGHGRKVTLIKFHPTANNVLASTSSDFSVRLWDIEKGSEIVKMEDHGENLIQDLAWSWTGSLLATTCKDKVVRLYDARSGQIAAQKENAHMGTKSVKMSFLGNKETFVTVGFTRQSQRQFKVWDPRNLDKELKKVDIDQAAGVIMPFYDPDTNLLYLCGKGDGNIRYYEMSEGEPFAFPISEYRSTTSAKGMAMIPKRGCDIMKCESARLLKLTSNAIEPLHVFVPRKSDAFQDDIFPDTYAGIPSMTADDWLGGADNSPSKVSIPRVFASSNDYRLRVTPQSYVFFEDSRPDAPAGSTVAICLPGIGDTRRQFRLLAPLLHDKLGFRVLLGDLRGFGDSTSFDDNPAHDYSAYSPESVALDVASLMEKLSAADPTCSFVLLGNSLSAGSMVLAADSPMDSWFRPLSHLMFRPLYGAWVWGAYYKTLFPGKLPDDFEAELDILKKHLKTETGNIVNVGRFARASKVGVASTLDNLGQHPTLPVLAFFGCKDPDYADFNAEIEWFKAAVPHAQCFEDVDGGHYPHLENPERVVKEIEIILYRE
ncbi:hypothetical protein JG687_00005097 [Phytophthora cactorum]|uniref:Coronin n=1 Tax=Phytophthora cactorum TaxID=29920 RepID=A0A8T1UN78_9STRA|nr:hypothetical protein JG687_00005097 [Phytophthora cactorum]